MQDFNFKIEKTGITLLEYLGDEDIVVIPEKYKGKSIKKISSMCFFSKESLKEVYFPKTVSEIEHNAFVDCPRLRLIKVHNIRELGNIFEDCPTDLKIVSDCLTNVRRFQEMFSDYDLTIYNSKNFLINVLNKNTKEAEIVGLKKQFAKIVIPDKIDEYKIIKISSDVFRNNKILESIELPEYLERISANQFKNCKKLENVEIKSNVVEIERNAFKFCKGLTHIEFPSSIKTIGEKAFSQSGLKNVVLNDNLTKISEHAFSFTENLNKVIMNDEISEIGDYCFAESNICEIELPKKIEKLPIACFKNCNNLHYIKNSKNLKELENQCFSGCSFLEITEEFINSLKYIGSFVFENCLFPKEFTLKSKIDLKDYAFASTKNLSKIEIHSDTDLKTLPKGLFYKSSVERVCLSHIIVKLEDECFQDSKISEINIEDITEIGNSAFSKCQELVEITIPNNLLTINDKTFHSCKNLKTVNISKKSKLEEIGEYAFYSTLCLDKISCPNNLRTIKDCSFGYSGISNILLNDNLNYIGNKAFAFSKVKHFIIPEGIKELSDNLFLGSSLETIDLHENITAIGTACFSESKLLKEVKGLETTKLEQIKDYVFNGCIKLTNVKFPNTLKKIGHKSFMSCGNLKIIEFPDNLNFIRSSAFYNAKINEKITFGKEDLIIDMYAFNLAILPKNLTIPENIKEIREYAFVNNKGLDEIQINSNSTLKLALRNFESSCIRKIKVKDSKVRSKIKNRIYFKDNGIEVTK